MPTLQAVCPKNSSCQTYCEVSSGGYGPEGQACLRGVGCRDQQDRRRCGPQSLLPTVSRLVIRSASVA
jgi:hypothetical protein